MTTYKEAGVDVEATNESLKDIIELAKTTETENIRILEGIGGFASAFQLAKWYNDPTFVTCTDGVGTKLKLAERYGKYGTIGRDLVAMCINDLIVTNAQPLVFLDYYASNTFNKDQFVKVLHGIAIGCEIAGCALVGGETAELPNTYKNSNAFELVGFALGILERGNLLDGSLIEKGDYLVGVPSVGLHSNGYSLINALIESGELDEEQTTNHDWFSSDISYVDEIPTTLSMALMAPTHIYSALCCSYRVMDGIRGMAHITGGGLVDNVPRMFHKRSSLKSDIYWDNISFPLLFQKVQEVAGISREEMFKTFNCGVGMVLAVQQTKIDAAMDKLQELGYNESRIIGRVID